MDEMLQKLVISILFVRTEEADELPGFLQQSRRPTLLDDQHERKVELVLGHLLADGL